MEIAARISREPTPSPSADASTASYPLAMAAVSGSGGSATVHGVGGPFRAISEYARIVAHL